MTDSPVSKKRLEDLERRVKELETKPSQESHFHYHYPAYQWYPQINTIPLQWPQWPQVWYGTTNLNYTSCLPVTN